MPLTAVERRGISGAKRRTMMNNYAAVEGRVERVEERETNWELRSLRRPRLGYILSTPFRL